MATKGKKLPKINPIGDRVLVKVSESKEEKKTASGIIIPNSVEENKGTKRGKVIAVGEGKRENGKLIKLSVKVGDTILFSWGDDLTFEKEDFVVVSESNILAVIN